MLNRLTKNLSLDELIHNYVLVRIKLTETADFFAAEKIARFCSEFAFFSFVYFLFVGIPILKIVLPHAHKWVTSDVIL